jgi:hypothetical protein
MKEIRSYTGDMCTDYVEASFFADHHPLFVSVLDELIALLAEVHMPQKQYQDLRASILDRGTAHMEETFERCDFIYYADRTHREDLMDLTEMEMLWKYLVDKFKLLLVSDDAELVEAMDI